MEIKTLTDLKPGQKFKAGDCTPCPSHDEMKRLSEFTKDFRSEYTHRGIACGAPLYYSGFFDNLSFAFVDCTGNLAKTFYTFEAFEQLCKNTFCHES